MCVVCKCFFALDVFDEGVRGGGSALIAAAPYRRNAHSRGEGCQGGLLLQARRSMLVVEFKRKAEIGTVVVDEVSQKVRLGSKLRNRSICQKRG